MRPGSSSWRGSTSVPWNRGQGLEHAAGQVRVDQEGHPRRQQRVPAEHRHEPRGAGGDHDPLGIVGIEDTQRTQVLGAPGHHLLEHRVVRLDLGDLPAPGGHALARRGPLDRLPAPVLRGEHLPVDHRPDLDAGRPLASGRHDHLVADEPRGHPVGARRADLDPPGHRSAAIGVDEGDERFGRLRSAVLPALLDLAGDGPELDVASDAPFLDREQVGEIGVDEHVDRAHGGLVAEVAQQQLLAHALTHMALPEHHHGGVGPPGGRQVPGHEGGAEGVVVHGGQGLGPVPVEQDLEPGQDAGVAEEQPLGTPGMDVAGPTADGERRLVDQGDGSPAGAQLGDRARVVPGVDHGGTVPAASVESGIAQPSADFAGRPPRQQFPLPP